MPKPLDSRKLPKDHLFEIILNLLKQLSNDEFSPDDILEITNRYPWHEVIAIFIHILEDSQFSDLWADCIKVLYFEQNTHKSFELVNIDYLIALMYHNLSQSESLDENLIWTITHVLKKVEYLSDYDPYHDEKVWKYLSQLNKKKEL